MTTEMDRLLDQQDKLIDAISNEMKQIEQKIQNQEIKSEQILQFMSQWDDTLSQVKIYLHEIKNSRFILRAIASSIIGFFDKIGDTLNFGGKEFFSSKSSAITMCAVVLMAAIAVLNMLGIDIHGLIPDILRGAASAFGG